MHRFVVIVIALGACKFEPGTLTSATDDAPIDPTIDAGDPLIDAPTAPADARVCPAAPTGCNLFTCAGSSSCYYECGTTTQTKSSWTGAVAGCTNGNLGCLVTINDQAEQNCITAATVPSFASYVWFGYRQPQPVSGDDEPAQTWGWQCGTSSYVQPGWGVSENGEPNDTGGGEDCAAMTGGGGWFDATCSGSARYVCELP